MVKSSLILDIQTLAISPSVDAANLLRMAKVAAVKLSQTDAVTWIDAELDGYNCGFDDLPSYRQIHGTLKFKNPYHGLIPAYIKHKETEELLTRAPVAAGIGVVQSLCQSGDALHYNMGNTQRNIIIEMFEGGMEPILQISPSQLQIIIERVISLVLNWSLELEKVGVLGEGMSFSMTDSQKATPVTQTIIAQNIGMVGDVSHNSRATITQKVAGLNEAKLLRLLDDLNKNLHLLPLNEQQAIEPLLLDLKVADSVSKKVATLDRIKNVLENAGGNVVAVGFLTLIASVFS